MVTLWSMLKCEVSSALGTALAGLGFDLRPLDSELAPWLGVDWNPNCETRQMRVCIGLGVSRVDYLFALGVRTS